MERTEVLDMMSGLKLYGMRSAYDEDARHGAQAASMSRSASSAIS